MSYKCGVFLVAICSKTDGLAFSVVGFALHHRRAAKLGSPDNECVLQQSTSFQVFDERSHRSVDFLALFGNIGEDTAVMVPAGVVQLNESNTALYEAAKWDHPEIVGLLIKHGANPNVKPEEGHTPLTKASRLGNTEVVRVLLTNGVEIDTVGVMEKTMILRSIEHHRGNLTRVAESLGLSRQALYRRMEKYGIKQ